MKLIAEVLDAVMNSFIRKFIQSRVPTLRLWLQLWETQTGTILCGCA